MASANAITIDLKIGIPREVAQLCLQALEIFINQNPEINIIGDRLPDGTTKFKFVISDDSTPPKG